MSNLKLFLFGVGSAIALVFLFVFYNLTLGWTNPTANPPTGSGAISYSGGNVSVSSNFGIATTTPGQRFVIATSTSASNLLRVLDNGRILVASTGTDPCAGFGCASDKLQVFAYPSDAATEAMWISNSGSSGGLGTGLLIDQASSATTNRALYINSSGGTTNYGIYVNNGQAYFSGNVGMGSGNTAPTKNLDVAGAAATAVTIHPSSVTPDNGFNGDLVITDALGHGQYINLINSGNSAVSIGHIINSNTFAIGTGQTTDSNFVLPSSLGCTTCAVKFVIGLNSGASPNGVAVGVLAAATANTLCYNTVTFTNMYAFATCSSSRRYKEDIHQLVVDKQKVFNLQPVNFKWKGRNERGVGLIAEDTYAQIPELTTTYQGKIEGVRYGELSVYLLDIVKKQDAEIESLKARVDALEKR